MNRFTGPKLRHTEKASSTRGGETKTTNHVGPDIDSDDGSMTGSDAHDSEVSTTNKGGSKMKKPTTKAGGMRRKNLRKR